MGPEFAAVKVVSRDYCSCDLLEEEDRITRPPDFAAFGQENPGRKPESRGTAKGITLIVEVAGHKVAVALVEFQRHLHGAPVHDKGTSWMEPAALWGIDG